MEFGEVPQLEKTSDQLEHAEAARLANDVHALVSPEALEGLDLAARKERIKAAQKIFLDARMRHAERKHLALAKEGAIPLEIQKTPDFFAELKVYLDNLERDLFRSKEAA